MPIATAGAKTTIRNWFRRRLALCAVGIAVAIVTISGSVSAADFPAADELMARLMSAENVPGTALALIKNGRIVLEKGYGFRDLETHAPVTTTTLFNIGSISKSFTALAIAQLVDQRQVDLDAPVTRYIPDFRLSDPQQAPDRAQPYRHDAALGDVPVPWSRLEYLEPLAPAGGIDANVDDIAHYALLGLGEGMVSGHRLVSARMLAEWHQAEVVVGEDWAPSARADNLHYALGWFTADRRGVPVIFHSGINPGFRAAMALVPSAQAGVVILTNGESSHFTRAAMWSLIDELLR